ncbi:hypothetical protein [Xanthobacter wiegelii]|uniref:hypothetical protein n=1 Tax=Xanthobacter wiegelii TaxID=3119913 RepID=UPI00372728D4
MDSEPSRGKPSQVKFDVVDQGGNEALQVNVSPKMKRRTRFAGAVPLPPPEDGVDEYQDWFAPFDGQPIEMVPAYVVDRLLRPNTFYERFPWPYLPQEMSRILSGIPKRKRIYAAFDIVLIARKFLFERYDRRSTIKSDPAGEVDRLHSALRELDAAISALSIDAHRHLAPTPPPRSPTQKETFMSLPAATREEIKQIKAENELFMEEKSHFSISMLQISISRFKIDNRSSLEVPPMATERRGRPPDLHAKVRACFACVFAAAHDGTKPARGRPAFIEQCCSPLGLQQFEPKSIERSLTRKARQKGT